MICKLLQIVGENLQNTALGMKGIGNCLQDAIIPREAFSLVFVTAFFGFYGEINGRSANGIGIDKNQMRCLFFLGEGLLSINRILNQQFGAERGGFRLRKMLCNFFRNGSILPHNSHGSVIDVQKPRSLPRQSVGRFLRNLPRRGFDQSNGLIMVRRYSYRYPEKRSLKRAEILYFIRNPFCLCFSNTHSIKTVEQFYLCRIV